MSRASQHVTNDEKVIIGLKHINVEATQGNLQMTITWTKESRKGE